MERVIIATGDVGEILHAETLAFAWAKMTFRVSQRLPSEHQPWLGPLRRASLVMGLFNLNSGLTSPPLSSPL